MALLPPLLIQSSPKLHVNLSVLCSSPGTLTAGRCGGELNDLELVWRQLIGLLCNFSLAGIMLSRSENYGKSQCAVTKYVCDHHFPFLSISSGFGRKYHAKKVHIHQLPRLCYLLSRI